MSSEANGSSPVNPKAYLPQINLSGSSEWHWIDAGFQACWPATFELMSSTRDTEGKWRPGTTIMFFAEGGRLKVCLNDKATAASCFLTIDPHLGPWDQIEEAIVAGLDWRRKRSRG